MVDGLVDGLPAKISDSNGPPTVAILPWGDAIEDFLTPLGLDARTYLDKADGGWLFGYAAALQQAGLRPVILWGSNAVKRAERLAHPATGTTIWLFPSRGRPDTRSANWTSIRRWLGTPAGVVEHLLRQERCRAIISQEYEDARFDRWIGLGRKLSIPVFASFQGGDRTASAIEGLVRSRSISRAAGLIVPSSAERDRIVARYGSRLPPVAAIPNPLDITRWQAMDRADARRRLGVAPEAFVAINHGRIDIHRKGLDVLVGAWSSIAHAEADRLVIIGSGQDDAAFAKLIEEAGTGTIDWRPGYNTDREWIRTWLCAADIYVTASRIEGMPVAPLEAMACNLPMVASDAQGLDDILKDGQRSGGLMVPKGDADALAGAIADLREDANLRQELGRAARRRIEESFSLPTVGSALGDFIKPALI